MHIFLVPCFLLILQCSLVLSHNHKRYAHELHLYRKRYELQHRSFITKCNEKIKARQLKRVLSPNNTLHPARQQSLLQQLNIRADNATTTNSTTVSPNSSSCVLDGEVTQGPYHVLGELIRQNITEGQGGVPVTFDIDFVDYTTCEPLKNAWVDIWHANSTGFYSGFTSSSAGSSISGPMSESSNGTSSGAVINTTAASNPMNSSQSITPNSTSTLSITFASPPQATSSTSPQGSSPGGIGSTTTDELSFDRGIWRTDEEGHFTMYDSVPGWYSGRAVHTHLKVYDESSGYQAENGTFVANNSAYHTGQWFWPQDFLALLADLSPYSENTLSYNDSTKNSQDTIYPDAAANGNEAEMTITWINASDIMAGVIASTVVGVNLTYSSVETGGYYWTGNITQAQAGSSSLQDSSTGTAATDGVAAFLSNLLTTTLLAGSISLAMLSA